MTNQFPSLQTSILTEGAKLARAGGRLVYATCSITHYENEDVVEAFEASDAHFFEKWERWNFDKNETAVFGKSHQVLGHCCVLLPSLNGSDGFFIARWKRRKEHPL